MQIRCRNKSKGASSFLMFNIFVRSYFSGLLLYIIRNLLQGEFVAVLNGYCCQVLTPLNIHQTGHGNLVVRQKLVKKLKILNILA